MKQITQNYKTGELKIEDVPEPLLMSMGAKVKTRYSVISAGTERATLEISKKSIIGKAHARPDLVKKVIETSKKIGFKNTFDLVMSKLNTTIPLGYSMSGIVEEVAEDVAGIKKGDRVACAGAGYANHAEKVFVPRNLMAKIPEHVSDQEAAFTTVGSIALHGVRQACLHIGDRVGVIGLGLVGQVTVGLLKAQGCKVFGIDLHDHSLLLSKEMGADETSLRNNELLESRIEEFTDEMGLDAVLITAGTDSNDPFLLAADILRDRGTLVVVGGIRMEIIKSVSSTFYIKEICVKFSRSYGPGRYDINYEEKGNDYPEGYVRWTENRNMDCFLEMLETRKIDLRPIITHTFSFEKALDAYKLLEGNPDEKYIGILLKYRTEEKEALPRIFLNKSRPTAGKLAIGMIGAGNFAQANILPHLKNNSVTLLNGICTAKGIAAKNVAKKYGFSYCASEPDEIIHDQDNQIVFITTRHDSHAKYVVKALKAGKHVFVEKPLCISMNEFNEIIKICKSAFNKKSSKQQLLVGYNRRFAPLSMRLKEFFQGSKSPITVVYRVNAGHLPLDNWYQDPSQGGRFIGEGGHFVDFVQYLTGSLPLRINAVGTPEKNKSLKLIDNLSITMQMQNGSVATIVYNASGASNMPKERIEVFAMNSSGILDDFTSLTLYRNGIKKTIKNQQDKGYKNELRSFLNQIKNGGDPLISFNSLAATSLATFAVIESIQNNESVEIDFPFKHQ
jgi:predicted dehydrogenase/threonine dehydrogenase-like Zn-dependent dehydrogenase